MKRIKLNTITVLLLVFAIVATATGSIAWLTTKTSTQNNEFAFEKPNVEVEENFNGWNLKEVALKNTSERIPCIVRCMLVPRVLDEDGNYINLDLGDITAPVNNKIVMGEITLEMQDDWSDNWFFKDGFFYCKNVLEAGETSDKLLKKVTLTHDDAATKELYKDYDFKVDVLADILQAEGGASAEWGVTVNGSTVASA